MESPAISHDASTWVGRISVHQDFFWFAALVTWGLIMILWWRHPQRQAAWVWLPGAGLAAIGMAFIQFEIFNPTFDVFQDRLIPGTVGRYRPALIDPYWLGDVLIGVVFAGMVATWGWLAARRAARPHLQWLPGPVMAAGALLHAADPVAGGLFLSVTATLAALALWPLVRAHAAARRTLVFAALLPVFSTIGPLAAVLGGLQRSSPPTPFGLGTAAFLLLLGGLILFSLARGLSARLPAETNPAFRRDRTLYFCLVAGFLALGLGWAIQTGRDNRREIQQNRLRTAAAHAKVFDPELLAPLGRPEFKIDRKSAAGEPAPAHSAWLAGGAADAARRRLAEVVIATPFLESARLVVIHDGWLVAALSSEHDIHTGHVELLRRATPEDYARWEKKEPHIEESPVPEIGYVYFCRAPILAPDGTMLAWLDCVRREYYLSIERRWRAAPFLMTALGVLLLTLVFLQRQIGREREIALRNAAAATEGSRVKTVFLANVSHELRTPLQSILGYGELLRQELEPRHHARLDALRQQGELMTRLVNDLIDLSAVEAGSFQLMEQPVAPAALVQETVESLRPRAAAKGLALRTELAAGLPAWVATDGARLRQVLVNLAGNALKFTDRGDTDRGEVVVSLRADHEPDGRIRLALTVRDTGPGIPPADQSRLFQAFSRLEQTATHEGAGLGLALSAALCRTMGGKLGVTSDGATGSTFTAVFRTQPALPPVAKAAPARSRPGFAPRVLVVDDNRLIRELFVAALTEHGACCRTAGSGTEALARCGEEAPEVIVLDLALPDGIGTDFVGRLRALAPAARIIGVSAHTSPAERDRALAAGMEAFLMKPVALDELWAAIAGALPATREAAPGFDLPEPLRLRLLAEFAREWPAKRAELAAALATTDRLRLRAQAHYLRNSALVLRADALFTACSGLEEAAPGAPAAELHRWWLRCAAAGDALQPAA